MTSGLPTDITFWAASSNLRYGMLRQIGKLGVHFGSLIAAETLASRFTASFKTFVAREDCRNLLQPIETEILNMAIDACCNLPFGPGVQELLQSAARQMARQTVDGTIRSILEGVGAFCESALEVSLCLALGIAARSQEYAVLFDFGGARVFGDPEGDVTVRIRPQVRFGDYRVDLLVSVQVIEGPEHDIRVYSKSVVVECDGFEFHNVTKEQACRDRQRDRYLQSLGLPVLRFAAAEVWADVFQFAGSILSFLLAAVASEHGAVSKSLPKKPTVERSISLHGDRRRA